MNQFLLLFFYVGGSAIVVPANKKGKGKKRGTDAGSSKAMDLLINDFGIEYAVSGRAACSGCQQKIPKGEIRIKKLFHDTEVGMRFGGQAVWHHVECFAQLRAELGWFASAEMLPGYNKLSADDKKIVLKNVPLVSIFFTTLSTDNRLIVIRFIT